MRNIIKNILMFFCAVSLTALVGCSSSEPNKNYFQLANNLTNKPSQSAQVTKQFIWIESINVASFLNKLGIVLQTENIKYVTATNNLWVSSLSQQLEDRLVQDLTLFLPNYLVSNQPIMTPSAKVKLFIDGFHGSYTGDAVVKGRWVITNSKNEIVTKFFDRRVPLANNGYDALVNALSTAWQDEELDFANTLKR